MRPIEVGETLDNRYEVLECIGAGGMGKVYRARQIKLDRMVALKVPSDAVMEDPNFAKRFEREATTVARFQHENIVAIHDVYVEPDLAYIAMEFVDGLPLDRFMRDGYWTLRVNEAIGIIRQCCDGLSAAHAQGVVHRDIKPANIFVTNDTRRVKIMDFGIARVGDATMLTQTGSVMGTPQYMSPEQIKGETLGPPSDIYAMTVLIFQILTLANVFEGETTTLIYKHIHEPPPPPRERNARLPEAVDDVLTRGLAKEPTLRQQSAVDLAISLEAALETWLHRPYHELLQMNREQLISLGIPTTPPVDADDQATVVTSSTPVAGAAPPAPPAPQAPPKPQAPPTAAPLPPSPRPTALTPSPTGGPRTPPTVPRAQVKPALSADAQPSSGTHAVRTMAVGTAKVTKTVGRSVALPALRGLARGLWEIVKIPGKVFIALPASGRLVLIVVVAVAGGGVYYYRGLSTEQRSGIGERLSAIGRTDTPDVVENRSPRVTWWGGAPRSRFGRLQMSNARFQFVGDDPDGTVTHYIVQLNDEPSREVSQRSDRAWAQWRPPSRLGPGPHTLTVVAVDSEGGQSAPLVHRFEGPPAEEEEGGQGASL